MSDQPELVVVNLAMTLNVTPAQLASMMLVLTGGVAVVPEVRVAAPGLLGLGTRIEHPDQYDMPLAPEPEPVTEPPASAEPPAPAKPLRAAPRPVKAKGNGVRQVEPVAVMPDTAESPAQADETPPPPAEPEILPIEDIRTLLKRMSNAVPGRDATVLKMLEAVGGGLRVADCPRETWPAIIAAARAAIEAHGG